MDTKGSPEWLSMHENAVILIHMLFTMKFKNEMPKAKCERTTYSGEQGEDDNYA